MSITKRATLILIAVVAMLGMAFAVNVPTSYAQNPLWHGEYYPNTTLSGTPYVRDDATIDFNWGAGAPWAGFPADNFSVRWSRPVYFEAGNYRFTTTSDDGIRLSIDGQILIDQWKEQASTSYNADVRLAAGWYTVKVEYLEKTGGALAKLTWNRTDAPQPPITAWRGEYYNNGSLSGVPTVVRNDNDVKFNWGTGSPAQGIGSDNFSARWTRSFTFAPGNYEFTVSADDGARLYIDNVLLIDAWGRATGRSITKPIRLTAGAHTIRLEYMEQTGDAKVNLGWNGPIAPAGEGNLITCVPPYPSYSWIKVYRLQADGTWVDVNSQGWAALNANGTLKIDGLTVDYARYGEAGHPYRVERWINGQLANSIGNTATGEPAFRILAGQDVQTPWGCN